MTVVGWLAALMLAACAVPQVFKSLRTMKADDLSWGFLAFWFGGEVLGFAYMLPKRDWPILVNYGANAVFVGIILAVKVRGKVLCE